MAFTVIEAVAVLPAPPSLDSTVLVVLVFTPALVPVTFTENTQEALAASVAPERLTLPLPAVAVMVPPPHDPVRPFGVEITVPAGKVSGNPTPVSELPLLGLVIVKVRLVEPPTEIDAAPKLLLIVGGDAANAG